MTSLSRLFSQSRLRGALDRALMAGAAAVVAVAATAVSGAATKAQAPTAARPPASSYARAVSSTSNSTSPGPTSVAPLPACTASQLSLGPGRGVIVTAGTVGGNLVITNVSQTACQIEGTPRITLQLYSGQDVAISEVAESGGSSWWGYVPSVPVDLAPGEVASFTTEYSDDFSVSKCLTPYGFPAIKPQTPTVIPHAGATLLVQIPGVTGTLVGNKVGIQPCVGDAIYVSPLMAGDTLPPNLPGTMGAPPGLPPGVPPP